MNRVLVFAPLLLLSGRVAAQDEAPPPPPMIVTSDTADYCARLWRQIQARGSAVPAVVRDLGEEGHSLCDDGQVRGGINRLRRALMMLQDERKNRRGNEPPGDRDGSDP